MFVIALGQCDQAHEGIIQHLVKETDFGKVFGKVVGELKTMYGGEFVRVSGDGWNVLLDKAEKEAYDNIKMVHRGDGVTSYGVLYRWFT